MIVTTDIDYWDRMMAQQVIMHTVIEDFLVNLGDGLGKIGTPAEAVDVDITPSSYSAHVDLIIQGMPSVHVAAQQVAEAAQINEPTPKLRFIGGAIAASCEVPFNEWYLTPVELDDGRTGVNLHYKTNYSGRSCSLTIKCRDLPAPGYLHAVKETASAAEARVQAEKEAVEEGKKRARNTRARETRARRKHPQIEATPTQKPMLLGPKELSLCADAPGNPEPELQIKEEASAN